MAVKRFTYAIREPHVAELGDDIKLTFRPDVDSLEFMDYYAELKAVQDAHPDASDPESARAILRALRGFLTSLATDETATLLGDPKKLPLPTDILTGLMEFAVECYGGGKKERPTGRSNG
jgi:hypothetical protein